MRSPSPSMLATPAFVTYALSSVGLAAYLAWALLGPALAEDAVEWLPSTEWAVLLPAWLTVAVWLAFLACAGLNILRSPPTQGQRGLLAVVDRAGATAATDHGGDAPSTHLRDVGPSFANAWTFRRTPRRPARQP